MRKLNENKGKIFSLIILIIPAIAIITCLFFIIRSFQTTNQAAVALDSLRENHAEAAIPSSWENTDNTKIKESEPAGQVNTSDNYELPYESIDFASMQAETNAHIYAWITIPDTTIDYPVLQHPTDNSYYLNHNMDGSKGYPGCIYTENYNSTDWTDANTILYGHNMKNGTMFAGLHKYADTAYFEVHPYIYIYTPDHVRIYQIFGAYTFTDQHVLTVCDWEDAASIEEYQASIFDNPGNFDQSVVLNHDSKIITLSTCIKNQDTKRFLVQGVLVAEDALPIP